MDVLTMLLTALVVLLATIYAAIIWMRSHEDAAIKTLDDMVAAKNPQKPSDQAPRRTPRILLVTAHPDDESMFFGPTLVSLCKKRSVSLLCLSTGDYEKKGHLRKQELYEAAECLGIQQDNITIIRHTKLPDDPAVRWREEIVSEIVLREVDANDVDVVITFDRGGVSGHKNHTSIYNAMAILVMEKRLPKGCLVCCLQSVNLLRKYSGLLDVPMSWLLGRLVFTADFSGIAVIHRAMAKHKTQLVWYRKLYMVFSRYILVNTYEQLVVAER